MAGEKKITTREEKLAPVIAKAWQDPKYLAELKRDPKGVMKKEFGVDLPPGLSLEVLEESPQRLYLVVPASPQNAGELSEEQLEAVAGGACIPIGVVGGVLAVTAVPMAAGMLGAQARNW